MLRLAEGVILNLLITAYPFLSIILLRVTPTANRNSYRVAILVGRLPRVACFARNPGLGNRNSVRVAAACGPPANNNSHIAAACGWLFTGTPHVAAACGILFTIILHIAAACVSPLPMPSPRGGSSFLLCLRWLCGVHSPWGRLGWGLCGAPSPWGRLGWGFGWGLFSCSFHSDA